jgi:exodeoxyribonuclease V alpha subunit
MPVKVVFRLSSCRQRARLCFKQTTPPGGMRITAQQRDAVQMALARPLSVLAGGAGVGKTTALKALQDVARQHMRPVLQMAVSGRAARRMSAATGEPASTIAGFLHQAKAHELDLNSNCLLVIDEASMLDLPTLYRVMRAMQPSNALLLVGDPGQLPPVGFGLTFHVLASNDAVPRTELNEIHRQAASTGIPQASLAVRQGRSPELSTFHGPGTGVSFVDAPPVDALQAILTIIERLGGVSKAQIRGLIKNGPAGVSNLNRAIHNLLCAGCRAVDGFCIGESILWTVNDYDLLLMNGSLGRIRSIDGGMSVAWDDGRLLDIPLDRFKDVEHAYAITCHKASGSPLASTTY